ncbi:hypothetical protein DFJ74DRAFT_664058 [Hyaloraphidium curvatum]|nr:hypothetical protein DFJ74DRAFT_664058 [Hyaloraphidium curvatum]
MTPVEQKAHAILSNLRSLDLAHLLDGGSGALPPHAALLPCAASSPLLRLLRAMPKGAVLHAHGDSVLPADWVVREATYDERCHWRWTEALAGGKRPEFRFLAGPVEGWERVQDARRRCERGADAFDAELGEHLVLPGDAEELAVLRGSGELWPRFSDCFLIMDGLFSHLPFFRRYLRKLFEEFYAEGARHVELRLVPFVPYDVDDLAGSPPWTFRDALDAVADVELDFRASLPAGSHFSARVIYCCLRHFTPSQMRNHLETAHELSSARLGLVGFDIIGTELPAPGRHSSLRDYLPALESGFPAGTSALQPMLHVGQALPPYLPDEASENISLALRLVPRGLGRLSHCTALPFHKDLPSLLSSFSDSGIAVEVQPVSNHVLLGAPLVPGAGHLPLLLRRGVPVVLGPDDPAIWRVPFGVLATWDWFVAVLLQWESIGLDGLKRMVMDSVRFACVTEEERATLGGSVEEEWAAWVHMVAKLDDADDESQQTK